MSLTYSIWATGSNTTISADLWCPHCSRPPYNYVFHFGACPKIKEIEYYPDGTIKRIVYNLDK